MIIRAARPEYTMPCGGKRKICKTFSRRSRLNKCTPSQGFRILFQFLRFSMACGTYLWTMATMTQVPISSQSPQVSYPFFRTQFLISQVSQWENLTPSMRHPMQLMDSIEIPGALYIFCQLSAVFFLSSSLFDRVAILASQVSQSKPQQAICFFMMVE